MRDRIHGGARPKRYSDLSDYVRVAARVWHWPPSVTRAETVGDLTWLVNVEELIAVEE